MNIVLPMDEKLQKKFLFVVSLAFIGELKPKPAIQKDFIKPVRLLYRSESIEPISVYETKETQTYLTISKHSKSLKLRCPVGRKPEKVTNVQFPMEAKGFICTGTNNGPVEFHFESKEAVMLRIRKLHRKFTYLPWNGSVQVTESFEFAHDGPKPPESPSFSRIDFTKAIFRLNGNLTGSQVITRALMLIPKEAKNLQVRDEVGIIWGKLERSKLEEEIDVVQVPLRFPMVGGMSAAFDFHYTIKADSFIRPFKASSSPFKKLIQLQMFQIAYDIPIDNFKLTFVLPEDSEDIEHEMVTTKPAKIVQRTFRTFFSTIGEKEISFEFEKMTRNDLEKGLAVLFNFPFWGVYRKPLVILSSLIFLILAGLYLNRLDLSLRNHHPSKAKKVSTNTCNTIIRKLFMKRREILMNFEDLIASNLNTRANSEQKKNDSILCAQLEDQISLIQNGIFEKIKRNYQDSECQQVTTLNSLALKRLYDEQMEICKTILGEVCVSLKSNNNNNNDDDDLFSPSQSNSKTEISSKLKSKSFSSSSIVKLSQSTSRGLLSSLSSSGLNIKQTIEPLAEEAMRIDTLVANYEAKLLGL